MAAPRILVLMGPAGAGKTTVGVLLAKSLGWRFLDADDFHSAERIDRMHRGIPLTDAERAPWLRAIRDALRYFVAGAVDVVRECTELKETHRRRLLPNTAA